MERRWPKAISQRDFWISLKLSWMRETAFFFFKQVAGVPGAALCQFFLQVFH